MDLKDFIEKFAEQFEDTDITDIQASTNFQELEEWSSITVMSIIAMVKTVYGKTISGIEIRKCSTVKDLYELVNTL